MCLVVFLRVAKARGSRAMIDLSMFRTPTFIGLSLLTLLANAAGLPPIFILTSIFRACCTARPGTPGLQFLPLTLGMFFFGAVTGGLTGKVPFRILMATSRSPWASACCSPTSATPTRAGPR